MRMGGRGSERAGGPCAGPGGGCSGAAAGSGSCASFACKAIDVFAVRSDVDELRGGTRLAFASSLICSVATRLAFEAACAWTSTST